MHGAGRSRITHPFATLTRQQAAWIPFDLHVLSTPPAFILSQNRTLHKKTFMKNIRIDDSQNKKSTSTSHKEGRPQKNLTPHQTLPGTQPPHRQPGEE